MDASIRGRRRDDRQCAGIYGMEMTPATADRLGGAMHLKKPVARFSMFEIEQLIASAAVGESVRLWVSRSASDWVSGARDYPVLRRRNPFLASKERRMDLSKTK